MKEENDHVPHEVSFSWEGEWKDVSQHTFSLVARSTGLGNDAFSSASTDSRSEMVRGRV